MRVYDRAGNNLRQANKWSPSADGILRYLTKMCSQKSILTSGASSVIQAQTRSDRNACRKAKIRKPIMSLLRTFFKFKIPKSIINAQIQILTSKSRARNCNLWSNSTDPFSLSVKELTSVLALSLPVTDQLVCSISTCISLNNQQAPKTWLTPVAPAVTRSTFANSSTNSLAWRRSAKNSNKSSRRLGA